MPQQEQAFLNEEALVWLFLGNDGYGEPQVSVNPTVLSPRNRPANGVKWQKKRRHVTDPKENTITLDATAQVTNPVPINSRIWFGSIGYWNENKPDQEIMMVVWANETKDIKGRVSVYEIGMQRLHNI